LEVDAALLARMQRVLEERSLGTVSAFTGQLIVDFLRRIAASGFERDELTGVATRHDFMHRFKMEFASRGQAAGVQALGCFCVDLPAADRVDRDANLRSYSQMLERDHGRESVSRWGDIEFIVWPFKKVEPDATRRYTELIIERKHAPSAGLFGDWLALCIQTAFREAVPGGHAVRANEPSVLLGR
jgi:hypothetical protein